MKRKEKKRKYSDGSKYEQLTPPEFACLVFIHTIPPNRNIEKYPILIYFLIYKLSNFSSPNSEKHISFKVEDNSNASQTVYPRLKRQTKA